MSSFAVNLANNVDFAEIARYAVDPNFAFEQKLDGERLAVVVRDGQVGGVNRRGIATPVHRDIIKAFTGTSGTWVFDGEWVGDTFWAFDLPTAPNIETRTPYSLRRVSLDAIVPVLTERTAKFRLVPTHRTPEEKIAIARWVVEHHAEGLMIKDMRAVYASGKRSNGMLKAKLIQTVDCVVSVVGREGKRSVAVELFDGENVVDVGSVAVTDAMLARLQVGDVIEVIYLYCTDERRLYQPRFGRLRPDKLATECTVDQLKFTDKTVLATPVS